MTQAISVILHVNTLPRTAAATKNPPTDKDIFRTLSESLAGKFCVANEAADHWITFVIERQHPAEVVERRSAPCPVEFSREASMIENEVKRNLDVGTSPHDRPTDDELFRRAKEAHHRLWMTEKQDPDDYPQPSELSPPSDGLSSVEWFGGKALITLGNEDGEIAVYRYNPGNDRLRRYDK